MQCRVAYACDTPQLACSVGERLFDLHRRDVRSIFASVPQSSLDEGWREQVHDERAVGNAAWQRVECEVLVRVCVLACAFERWTNLMGG